MTIKKKLIGYGYTDSNGVATLDYNENGTEISTLAPTGSSGYIGRGVGSVQLEAGLHSSEAVVSEPCNVTDALFYDKGLSGTGNHNDDWGNIQNRLKITREDDGTKIESLGEQWAQLYVHNSNYYVTVPFAVEFQVVSYEDTPSMRFYNGSVSAPQVVDTGNWKFEFLTDDVKIYKNNQPVQYNYLTGLIGSSQLKVYWELSHPVDVVKYRDFRVYPI